MTRKCHWPILGRVRYFAFACAWSRAGEDSATNRQQASGAAARIALRNGAEIAIHGTAFEGRAKEPNSLRSGSSTKERARWMNQHMATLPMA